MPASPLPLVRTAFGAWTCALACAAQAQAPLAPDDELVRAFVSQQVAAEHGAQATRFDIQVQRAEARRTAAASHAEAACLRTQPFAPAGMRWWGRAVVGLRCVEGATWTLMVPVQVRIWGMAAVAAAPLGAGTVLRPQDLREQEIELTRESPGLAREGTPLQGRTLSRAVAAGQPMRLEMTRATLVVEGGEPVRLRMQGGGFVVSAGGVALHGAAEGQPVRVRTEFGRVVQGIARSDRAVDVTP